MAKQIGRAGRGARKIADRRLFVSIGLSFVFLIVAYLMLNGGAKLTKSLGARFSVIGLTISCFGIGLLVAAFSMMTSDEVDVPFLQAIRGAKAEEKVSDILGKLPDGFVVLNDVRCPLGNIDHIVVGPTGLFVIETKSHRGTIGVSADGHLVRNGKPLEKDFIKQVLDQAFWLKKELGNHGIRIPYVNAFIVFTRGFVQVYQPLKGVHVMNKKWLHKQIIESKSTLDEETRDKIVSHVAPMVEQL